MEHAIERRFRRTVLAVSIAALGFSAPLIAQAEESSGNTRKATSQDSQVEVGAGYLSDGSYKFGDYGRGLQEPGPYLVGNVWMRTFGSENGYLEFKGRNLGLNGSRDFGIKAGERGNYGLRFKYDELSKLHSDTFMTPYTGMGTTRLTGPAAWTYNIVPLGTTVITTANMNDLAASMKKFNVETKRKAAALGLTKQIGGGWDFAVNFKRENKDGTRLTGLPMQIGGQGNRGVLLAPEPINYTTDLFDAVARYVGENLHMQVGYHSSIFKNDNRSLVFDNLFYSSVSTVGGNALTGQLGQMPGNQFHQVSASGGYSISKETRLAGSLSIGRMTQNETFLPYSTAAAPAALPAASLNGKIDTAHADINLSSKLTQDIDFAAGYKYDDRDNKTPVNAYTYQTADVTTAPGASNTRQNTPLSKTRQVLFADIGYRLSDITRLRLGYDYDKVTHTFQPTNGDVEQTVKAEVKHSFSDTASGGLAYSHSNRNASAYNGAASLSATFTAAYLASLCVDPDGAGPLTNTFLYNGVVTACTGVPSATSTATAPFLDTPALRKFFLTDRKRDQLRAFANMAASETFDLQFGASYYKERYPDAEIGFGLARATGWTANFDANWAATEVVSGVFFASLEDYKADQNGHNGASCAAAGSAACSAGTVITTLDRQNNTAAFDGLSGMVTRGDRSLTTGLGFRFKPEDSYELGADFTYAKTSGSTTFSNIGARLLGILPVPDTVSTLNRLELFGKYHMQKDISLNLKYTYEKYDSTDWAWDGQTLTSSTSFIGSGQASPDYRVHVVSASVTYKF